jgi:hypothetical protein
MTQDTQSESKMRKKVLVVSRLAIKEHKGFGEKVNVRYLKAGDDMSGYVHASAIFTSGKTFLI